MRKRKLLNSICLVTAMSLVLSLFPMDLRAESSTSNEIVSEKSGFDDSGYGIPSNSLSSSSEETANWKIYDNGTMYVYGGEKLEKNHCFSEVNISNIYIEKGVSAIDDEVFSGCKKLEKVILNDGIREIGNYSFSNCENLKHIILPSSIETIGENAFLNCKNLTIYCNENSKAIDYAQKKGIKFKGIESFDSSLPIPIMEMYKTCKGHPKNISPGYCKEDDEFSFVCKDDCGMTQKYVDCTSIYTSGTWLRWKKYELVFNKTGEHIVSVYKNGKLMEYDKFIIEEHTWDFDYIKKEATCTQDGAEKYTCSKCNESNIKTIPKTGHRYGKWKVSKKATIFKKGEKKEVCPLCGKTLHKKEIKKLTASVKISRNKLKLKKGTIIQIKIKKKSKGDKIAKFISSNNKIATVDKNGKVTARKKGKAKITVKMKSGCKATCAVTVK